ncbi:phosphopantetheine-binding protein [Streptomyces sp. EN23]|uniref:phosphopantetheine-binding protein n=1 Tax=Streptomyces sp. EN23 TaxID=212774 RepID=UPI000851E123|nr:phosphopantetheine-binding protein [Streptomyces sp. EN23]
MTHTTDSATQPEPTHEFLGVLREFLPALPASEEPAPDATLASYGLDSLGSISLMLALEETLDMTFPEERLSAETFRTIGSLWQTVTEIRQAP